MKIKNGSVTERRFKRWRNCFLTKQDCKE